MPQQVLDHPDVDALFQQVGGEAVPQGVHGHRLVEPGSRPNNFTPPCPDRQSGCYIADDGADDQAVEVAMSEKARNVLGGELADCSERPLTGFFRDGCCNTSDQDRGSHTVCVLTTAEFLAFSRARGNDLSTPVPEFEFPGLKPGDRWCLCAARWQEAFAAGKAPRVVLQATHQRALEDCQLEDLKRHALDLL